MTEVQAVTDSIGAVLLKALITELRMLSPRFTHQDEHLQQEIIDRLRLQVEDQLREAIQQIAAKSFISAPGSIIKVGFKDEMQAVIKVNRTNPAVHDIVDAVGGPCLVVLCPSLEEFLGGMQGAVKPVPKQRDIEDEHD